MRTSEQLSELFAALAKAQAEISTVTNDKMNPHFKSHYATLAAVREACIPAMNRHGLSVVQMPTNGESGYVAVTTRLCHSSGQWLEDTMSSRPAKDGPQQAGSVVSYLRRYMLAAVAGLAQADDDGSAAEDRTGRQGPNGKQRSVDSTENLAAAIAACKTEDDLTSPALLARLKSAGDRERLGNLWTARRAELAVAP